MKMSLLPCQRRQCLEHSPGGDIKSKRKYPLARNIRKALGTTEAIANQRCSQDDSQPNNDNVLRFASSSKRQLGRPPHRYRALLITASSSWHQRGRGQE